LEESTEDNLRRIYSQNLVDLVKPKISNVSHDDLQHLNLIEALKKSEGNEPTEKFHGEERSNEDLEGQLQNYLVETTTVDKNNLIKVHSKLTAYQQSLRLTAELLVRL